MPTPVGQAIYVMPKIYIYPEGQEALKDRFVLLNVSLSGSFFGNGSASASVLDLGAGFSKSSNICVAGYTPHEDTFGGLWVIEIEGQHSYEFLITNCVSTRLRSGGKKLELSFDDIKNTWSVLKTNTIYKEFVTYMDLVNSLIAEANTLEGAVVCDDETILDTALSAFCDEGIYEINNSTFLAEIMKLLEQGGYNLYSDPELVRIKIIDPILSVLNNDFEDENTINATNSEEGLTVVNANYTLNYMGIPTSVVVTDANSPKTYAYGWYAGANERVNHDIAKRDQLVYTTVYGLSDAQMKITAENIYKLGVKSARVLNFTVAGIPFSPILWTKLHWTDQQGNTGIWVITDFSIEIAPCNLKTTLTAFKLD
jgi:hypothetical protein